MRCQKMWDDFNYNTVFMRGNQHQLLYPTHEPFVSTPFLPVSLQYCVCDSVTPCCKQPAQSSPACLNDILKSVSPMLKMTTFRDTSHDVGIHMQEFYLIPQNAKKIFYLQYLLIKYQQFGIFMYCHTMLCNAICKNYNGKVIHIFIQQDQYQRV